MINLKKPRTARLFEVNLRRELIDFYDFYIDSLYLLTAFKLQFTIGENDPKSSVQVQYLNSSNSLVSISTPPSHKKFRFVSLGLMMGMAGAIAVMNPTESLAIGFSGSYAPINWTLTNTNADGSVDTSGAPTSITVTGSDLGSGDFGSTSYTVTAAGSGTVTFNWSYSTADGNAGFDPLFRVLNGNKTILFNSGVTGSGTDLFTVATGDVFGFGIDTTDNSLGRASTTFSNFSAPVPFDFDPSLGLVALGLGFGGKRLLKTFLRNKSKKD